MSYHQKIRSLQESVSKIDVEIKNTVDAVMLNKLQETKSQYMSEIRRLNRLQWEEDHERVHFDDDR